MIPQKNTASAEGFSNATPMMQQYLAIKAQHSDCLLFYRMGDFYELFFDDALEAARTLDIALTKRGKHESADIPMCGVPFHSSDSYLQKLIRHGYKVAICEQMESPEEAKKRGYKSVVKREVIRIVTPGTITEDVLLEARAPNYLAALTRAEGKLALSFADISTGVFGCSETSVGSLSSDLARLSPKELLLPERMLEDAELMPILGPWRACLVPHVASFFEHGKGAERLKSCFGVLALDAFGSFSKAELGACGAVIEYLDITQKGALPRLSPPVRETHSHFMAIDAATRRSLELTETLGGARKGSLLATIDRTLTSGGARLLFRHLSAPLTDSRAIDARLDMAEYWHQKPLALEHVRKALSEIPDAERSISRICLGRGGPRDLLAIKNALLGSLQVAHIVESSAQSGRELPPVLMECAHNLGGHDRILTELGRALQEEVPVLARDGGFVAPGYHPKLDELRDLRDNSREKITALREHYRQQTGVSSLKIEQNNVIGFYIEVSPQASSRITDPAFIHRQTMASGIRYTTLELKQLESALVTARDTITALELEVFAALALKVKENAENLLLTLHAVARLDVAASHAELAADKGYVRPLVTEGTEFSISGGRHPVVENALGRGEFIPNDATLEGGRQLWLLTGPNMAGKSTFLRQNALIAILAQIGAFVPAAEARIGVVDRLFSRVGAADDLARGHSTFMVEMVETATILHQATRRSLVILDEIGRGTSTHDGLSIAWATLEYIHSHIKCRAIFATHYHELTSLAGPEFPNLKNYSMRVKEWQGEVVFLHEVIEGSADRSYGIHVARLAGLPAQVLVRAEQILAQLEGGVFSRSNKMPELREEASQFSLPLFSAPGNRANAAALMPAPAPLLQESKVEAELKAVDIDSLSPKQALEMLYKLKEAVRK